MLPTSRDLNTCLVLAPVTGVGPAGNREVLRTTGTREEEEEEATQSLLSVSLGDPEGSEFLSFGGIWATQGDLSGGTTGISRDRMFLEVRHGISVDRISLFLQTNGKHFWRRCISEYKIGHFWR